MPFFNCVEIFKLLLYLCFINICYDVFEKWNA